jgi:GrpB-like predicted nucleotidyltransferase (UPF0157 family)
MDRLEIVAYDPDWPGLYDHASVRIRSALGASVVSLEHVGSTAVPGLAAKPVIDVHLVVADSAREERYAPQLERAGYVLTIREPQWYEHRMFKGRKPSANLHVFSAGCPEVERVRLFRDWLRESTADVALYAETKRLLAKEKWGRVQEYVDAKQPVIAQIMERAYAWQAEQRSARPRP